MNETRWEHVYLSPHPDDVVLSCAGAIHTQVSQGARVLVVTFFSATPPDDEITPFALELKVRWGDAVDPMALRRAEDIAALNLLGAHHRHLPYADCVYRTDSVDGSALYPDEGSIFGEVSPSEADWHRGLASTLREIIGDSTRAAIYGPLTAGHHVDHLLVRRVALDLLRAGREVLLYEDYPYAGDPAALNVALETLPGPCRFSETVRFGDEGLKAKVAAVACHASQINTFWRDDQGDADLSAMQDALRVYSRAGEGPDYAERFWHLAPDCLAEREAADPSPTER